MKLKKLVLRKALQFIPDSVSCSSVSLLPVQLWVIKPTFLDCADMGVGAVVERGDQP